MARIAVVSVFENGTGRGRWLASLACGHTMLREAPFKGSVNGCPKCDGEREAPVYGPTFERREDPGDGTTRITYAPFHIQVKLTSAQLSALDCSGCQEAPEGEGETLIRDGIAFATLELLGRAEIETALATLTELANAEDAQAEDPARDRAQRAGDRGARAALSNLADRLIQELRAG